MLHQPKDNNNQQDTSSAIDHFHGKQIPHYMLTGMMMMMGAMKPMLFPLQLSIEKLFHLSEMMRTPMAQKMAEQRTQFMHEFVRQVEREYSLLI